MCGLFGFAGPEVDVKALTEVALMTEACRGGHAWGLAWIDDKGRLRMHKQPGRLSSMAGSPLHLCEGAKMVIGHVRFVTNGDPRFNINNHPHPSDGGWLMHNGTVPRHRTLANYWGVPTSSQCDSEVVAGLVEVAPRDALADRVGWALEIARQGTEQAILGLWSRPTPRIIAARGGKPLHFSRYQGGMYLASQGEHLPGKVYELNDNHVHTITTKGGGHVKRENARTGARVPGNAHRDKGKAGGKGNAGGGAAGFRECNYLPADSFGSGLFDGD